MTTRRSFLKVLAGGVALAALPAIAVETLPLARAAAGPELVIDTDRGLLRFALPAERWVRADNGWRYPEPMTWECTEGTVHVRDAYIAGHPDLPLGERTPQRSRRELFLCKGDTLTVNVAIDLA